MQQRKKELHLLGILLLTLAFLAVGCSQTATQTQTQQTAVVNPSFQNGLTPLPTVPPYRCGAWASNNAPNMYSTIKIFARLTHNIAGVEGAVAHSVVHFTNDGNVALDAQPISDNGGYVSFTLPLNGRQPSKTPATVSVSFTIPGVQQTINCSLAFFTPR
jgi:hypothetical protein